MCVEQALLAMDPEFFKHQNQLLILYNFQTERPEVLELLLHHFRDPIIYVVT